MDVLHVHDCSGNQAVMFEPVLNGLAKIKKKGKTRFVGVSTHSNEAETFRALTKGKFHDVVLTAYNFKQRNRQDIQKAIAEAAAAGGGRYRHENPSRTVLGGVGVSQKDTKKDIVESESISQQLRGRRIFFFSHFLRSSFTMASIAFVGEAQGAQEMPFLRPVFPA